ncbi:MAG TPA: M3 family peptidase, partial [Bacteroidia bacterium]|nr:M3 family peptidase [Bacteroidia bacterium]
MRKSTFLYSLLISSTGLLGTANAGDAGMKNSNEGSASSTMIETTLDQNPMLAKWSGPYGGIPPFDKIKISDFKPALEAAMEENLNEIKLIADNATPPTFENTIAAMERTGKTLDR